LEPVRLYAGAAAPLPPGEYQLALGEARLARPGGDVTVVAWGTGVGAALEAAEEAAASGVSLEVLDLQALAPLDAPALLASVGRTGRLVVVEGEPGGDGVGSEVIARVAAEGFWHLDAAVARVAPPPAEPLSDSVPGDAARLRPAEIAAAALSLAHT